MTQFRTMTQIAIRILREAVLEGRLPPGSRLIPKKLEGELDLGRVAIREAIRELVGLGLVESFRNKGTYVAAPPSKEEVEIIFKLRIILESELAYKAVKKINKKDLDMMEELHLKMEVESKPKNYFLLNRDFHTILYKASGCKCLVKIMNLLIDHVLLFRSLLPNVDIFRDKSDLIQDHRNILEAIKAIDSEKVKQVTIDHLIRGLNRIRL